jgi:hypothetical protein
VNKVLRVTKAPPERMETREFQEKTENLVRKVSLESLVKPVHKDLREIRESRVLQERRVPLENRA